MTRNTRSLLFNNKELLMTGMHFARKIIVVLLLSFVVSAQTFAEGKDSKSSLLDAKLQTLAETATSLAQACLAANPKDRKGLLLVKFANFFNQKYRPLLLLRGQLRYKVKIEKPKAEITELEFLSSLIKTVDSVSARNTEKNRNLLAILYSVIRMIKPSDEESLIALIELEDAGVEINVNKLLAQNISEFDSAQSVTYDKKDPRYIASSVKKTILVPASIPWTDSWVKVQAGKIIRVTATRLWSLGTTDTPFPFVGGEGYSSMELTKLIRQSKLASRFSSSTSGTVLKYKRIPAKSLAKKFKGQKAANLGCLLAKIGKKSYVVGQKATFKANTSGILYFGPFEWDDYSDNSGQLMVTFEVSNR